MATVVTNVGKGIIAQRMFGATPSQAEPKFVGWGTGAGTAAVGDTTLFTESAEARTSGTGSAVTTTNTNDTHQVTGTITASAGRTITNAGVLDASTVGNLYVKGDFTGVVLATGDSIAFTFKVQFT
jgi:hypothetical protein